MIEQKKVDEFYSKKWKSNIHLFRYSGTNLIKEVSDLNPALVIDAGCGLNFFKGKIPNVVGFDPVFNEADIKCTIMTAPFKDACADVIFAFGSVNFGTRDDIANHLIKLKSWLKPKGRLYMRGAPDGYDDGLKWFQWGVKEINYFAELVGFKLIRIQVEHNETGTIKERLFPHRYVWVYQRPEITND